jgi:hypothetical protein
MDRKLSFAEFQSRLTLREEVMPTLEDYVEFDPNSAVPRLIFKADALLDSPPPGFDLDDAVYQQDQEQDEQSFARVAAATGETLATALAEGDSWMNLPPLIRPKAIADRMKSNAHYKVRKIARWGHTAERMATDRQYIDALPKYKPTYFLLSAGGNDMQNGLEAKTFVRRYDAATPTAPFLTQVGTAGLARVGSWVASMLNDVRTAAPAVRVLLLGYDFPRPHVDRGKYIGRHLRDLGYPPADWDLVASSVLDSLNAILSAEAAKAGCVFVDLRHASDAYTWIDDMHPGTGGFTEMTARFEAAMA